MTERKACERQTDGRMRCNALCGLYRDGRITNLWLNSASKLTDKTSKLVKHESYDTILTDDDSLCQCRSIHPAVCRVFWAMIEDVV